MNTTLPSQTATPVEREFPFSYEDFDYLRKIVNGRTGIVVTDEKYDMFYSRLVRRIRLLRLQNFTQYCDLIKSEDGQAEIIQLVNAITTNLTSFFRENHHFEFLLQRVIPELQNRAPAERKLRIWSAGCSTGEEPYSIAMTVAESGLASKGWDIKILATDIDSNVLEQAASGVYNMDRVENLPQQRLQRWFLKGKKEQAGKVRVKPEVHKPIEFAQLNLNSAWVLPETVDIVFCRNVIIYFDRESKRTLIDRIAENLTMGGYLFIGHSESMFRVSERFELVGNTIYRKIK
jgi:chemotaxis protein methyltransferase CheR